MPSLMEWEWRYFLISLLLTSSELGKYLGYLERVDHSYYFLTCRLTPRDSEAIRRTSSILRYFSPFAVSPEWEPHTPTLENGIFARYPIYALRLLF